MSKTGNVGNREAVMSLYEIVRCYLEGSKSYSELESRVKSFQNIFGSDSHRISYIIREVKEQKGFENVSITSEQISILPILGRKDVVKKYLKEAANRDDLVHRKNLVKKAFG